MITAFCILFNVFMSLIPAGDLSSREYKAARNLCRSQRSPIAQSACFAALATHERI